MGGGLIGAGIEYWRNPCATWQELLGAGIEGALVGITQRPSKPLAKFGRKGGPGAGKPFSPKIKKQAEKESGGRCVFCNKPTSSKPGPNKSETDHAIPKSRGGNNSLGNAQNTCRTCNRRKSAKTTKEFLK